MLDLRELLNDPDLAVTVTLIRSVETVTEQGRSERIETEIPIVCVVLPATSKQLERLPDADRTSETVAVYSEFGLTSGTSTHAPDIVVWQGERYEVKDVQDFGETAGFCVAMAGSTSAMGRELEA